MSTLTVSNITGNPTSNLGTITTNSNTATFGTSVYMVANGNVGIGKSAPANKLEISGTLAAGSVIAKIENFSSSSGSQARLDFATGSPNAYQIVYMQDGATPYGEWSHGPGLTGGMWFTSATTSTPIIFRQGATERARVDASGNFQFNSGYGSVAVAYGCRAWVNFNGTGTVAIRASGNVTSITDNGTGDYTVNFTTAMPDANYSACSFGVGNAVNQTTAGALIGYHPTGTSTFTPSLKSTTQARFICGQGNAAALYDVADLSFQIFR